VSPLVCFDLSTLVLYFSAFTIPSVELVVLVAKVLV